AALVLHALPYRRTSLERDRSIRGDGHRKGYRAVRSPRLRGDREEDDEGGRDGSDYPAIRTQHITPCSRVARRGAGLRRAFRLRRLRLEDREWWHAKLH